jgi:hypothetical protein
MAVSLARKGESRRMCPPAGQKGGVARSGTPKGVRPEALRAWLLGGFRVAVGSRVIEEDTWSLRKAGLIRMLALIAGHQLHHAQGANSRR